MSGFEFSRQVLKAVVGGFSAIDLPRLDFKSLEEVEAFVKAYGYDLKRPNDIEEIWKIYAQSIEILEKYILEPNEKIPQVLSTQQKLEDIRRLFLYASTQDHAQNVMQMWSCAILRVMHCVAHVENDLFYHYTQEIQDQILGPVQSKVISNAKGEIFLGEEKDSDHIPLMKFETKAFKERHSMVIKTMSKPETVALDLFDKVGIRFVTNTIFDAFRVVKFLRAENIIAFANVVPHQSKNTLYPTNIFLDVVDKILASKKPVQPDEVEDQLREALKKDEESGESRAKYKVKHNPYSDQEYKVIKFIARSLINVGDSRGALRFFYPYEIQIMDYQTYVGNLSGTASHGEYKKRQRKAARDRALGELFFVPTTNKSDG